MVQCYWIDGLFFYLGNDEEVKRTYNKGIWTLEIHESYMDNKKVNKGGRKNDCTTLL